MTETRVTRHLNSLGIPFRLLLHAKAVCTVEGAARERGVPAHEVVKAILLGDGKGSYVLACVFGDEKVDPAAVRACLPGGWARLTMAGRGEIEGATGYPLGAVAPVDLPEEIPVVIDEAVGAMSRVTISSGDLGAGVELSGSDLVRASGGILGSISRG